MLDRQPRLEPIAPSIARGFIARHHAHCGVPVTWRFHNVVFNGPTLIGVAVVGNPVAPALMGRGILEVNRLCVHRDTPDCAGVLLLRAKAGASWLPIEGVRRRRVAQRLPPDGCEWETGLVQGRIGLRQIVSRFVV